MEDTSVNPRKGMGPEPGEGGRKHIPGEANSSWEGVAHGWSRGHTGWEEVCTGVVRGPGLRVARPLLCLLGVLKPTRGRSLLKVSGLGQASALGLRGHLEVTLSAPYYHVAMAGLAPISLFPLASRPWGSTGGW